MTEPEFKSGGFTAEDDTKTNGNTAKEAPKNELVAKEETTTKTENENKKESPAAPNSATKASNHQRIVKSMKNQFALNRLLLMLIDVKPEALSGNYQ